METHRPIRQFLKRARSETVIFVTENFATFLMALYLAVVYFIIKLNIIGLNQTGKLVLALSIGPVSVCYLLYRWWKPLVWIGETIGETWIGKLFYLIASAILYGASRTLSDVAIGSLLQTTPSHFPVAQNNLTIYFIIVLTMAALGIGMILLYGFAVIGLIFSISLAPLRWISEEILSVNPDMKNWMLFRKLSPLSGWFKLRKGFVLSIDLLAILLCGSYVTAMIAALERPSWVKDELGRPMSLGEKILFLSVFYRNDMNTSASGDVKRLICSNLPSEVYISIANPSDVVPNDVLVAELRTDEADIKTPYRCKLTRCINTNDPDGIRSNKPS